MVIGLVTIEVIMVLWSYLAATYIDPGFPLVHLPLSEPIMVKGDGNARFCHKCKIAKPDRAHHCRSCGRCVLKMDHHCPWLSGCIGYRNQKAFVLFISYASVYAYTMLLFGAFAAPYLFAHASYDQALLSVQWAILLAFAGVFGTVLAWFAGWHIYLVLHNRTTIESMEITRYLTDRRIGSNAREQLKKYRNSSQHSLNNPFDVGKRRNFEQVFGPLGLKNLLPIPSANGDGHSFPINNEARLILSRLEDN